jgi:hypothetical protein
VDSFRFLRLLMVSPQSVFKVERCRPWRVPPWSRTKTIIRKLDLQSLPGMERLVVVELVSTIGGGWLQLAIDYGLVPQSSERGLHSPTALPASDAASSSFVTTK